MRHFFLSHVRHLTFLAALGVTTAIAQDVDQAPWIACLRAEISRLDDRVSDARSVASAVTAQCRLVRVRGMQAVAGGRADLVDRALDRMRDGDIDAATVFVLEQRRR